MKINTMNENVIELYLTEEEVEKIFGGYELIDYDAPECRIKIHSLLISAAPETLFPLDCDKVLIEVKPKQYGCTIRLTKIHNNIKKYRQIKSNKTVTMIFDNSNDMISAISALELLHTENSELYWGDNKYAIIAEPTNKSRDILTHLGEFCKISLRKTDTVRIKEYWRLICSKNAIESLSKAFK